MHDSGAQSTSFERVSVKPNINSISFMDFISNQQSMLDRKMATKKPRNHLKQRTLEVSGYDAKSYRFKNKLNPAPVVSPSMSL